MRRFGRSEMHVARRERLSARSWRWVMRAAVLAIACVALARVAPASAQTPTLTASPTNPQVGQLVTFTVTTSVIGSTYSSPVYYVFLFGDGSAPVGSSIPQTTHAYTTTGTFSAFAYVCYSQTGYSTGISTVGIGSCPSGTTSVPTSPVTIVVGGTSTGTTSNGVLVTANGPYLGTVGSPIYFHGLAQCATSQCSGNFIYNWSFGDGTSGTGQNPTHTYSAAGTYTATLTVADVTFSGTTGSATAQVCVAPAGSTATNATCGTSSGSSGTTTTGSGTVSANGLTVSAGGPYTGSSGNPITFNGTASTTNSNATIVSYVWSFGDGTSGTGQSTTHTYNSSGNYTVALTVTDSTGTALTATTTASIQPGQRKINLTQGCTNLASTFPDNTPTGTIVSNVNPSSAVLSVWEYDAASQRFKGYLPGATQATDLPTVNRLDAIYICVNASATFTEPAI